MDAASKIKLIRARTSLSLEDFADRYEIPLDTLMRWEDGSQYPPLLVLEALDVMVRSESQ